MQQGIRMFVNRIVRQAWKRQLQWQSSAVTAMATLLCASITVSKHPHRRLMQQAALGTPSNCGKPTGRTNTAHACIYAQHQSHDRKSDVGYMGTRRGYK